MVDYRARGMRSWRKVKQLVDAGIVSPHGLVRLHSFGDI
jgi:hypothetical protein